MGNFLNLGYPDDDVDTTILTGFSKTWFNAIPGLTATALLLLAPGLPVGYLKANSEVGIECLLFSKDHQYDLNFVH